MMSLAKTAATLAVGSMLVALAGTAAAQQAFPSKPVRIVIPFPPGGGLTPQTQLITPKLSEVWGHQALMDYRPGANTIIGTDAVAKAVPDGHTLLLQGNSHPLTPLLIPTPYDPIKDFAPIATITAGEMGLAVHPSINVKNLQELVALAKAKPGQLNYGTSGTGSLTHLAIELIIQMTGMKMVQVPYKGSGPLMTDLLGGQVQVYFGVASNLVPHVKSGKLVGMGITGERRLKSMPQMPTFIEAGLPEFNMRNWTGILAPAKTPKALVDKLSLDFRKVMEMPDVRDRLVDLELLPYSSTPEQFLALLQSDVNELSGIIKRANIKLDP